MTKAKYLIREASVSAVINGLISTGFFFAFFRNVDPIPVWGIDGYAFDFVPQSFAVSLMSALIPGFLARKGLAAGRFDKRDIPAASSIVICSFAWAFGGLIVGASGAALILSLVSAETIGATTGLIIKIAFGGALGAIITHRSVSRLIG